jgi:alpha-1,2-mannosyltransferase
VSTVVTVLRGGDGLRPHVRAVVLVLALVFIGSAVRNIKEDGDFRGYLEVGELVLQGRDIYADARPDVNTWPPLFAVLCVPFALLARVNLYLARAVWLLINAYLVFALLRITIALVYHRPLALDPGRGVSIASAAVLGPLVLSSRFFLGNFDRLQINLFILFCCLAACLLLARRRTVAGGALLGFAAAVKVLPVFFVPYLLAKRWWRALGAAVVTGAVATAAPILVFGPARWWAYVRRWLDIAGGGWPVRKGNQSVYAMVDRLYSHEVVTFTDEVKRLRASDDPLVAALVYGSLAVIVVVFLWTARRGGRDPASPPATVEYAIVLALAVLFSPLAWKHYFVFLLLGYAVLWRAVFEPSRAAFAAGDDPRPAARVTGLDARTRRVLGAALVLSFALTTLSVRGIVGKTASLTFETLSAVTLGALVALAALLLLRARLSAAGG